MVRVDHFSTYRLHGLGYVLQAGQAEAGRASNEAESMARQRDSASIRIKAIRTEWSERFDHA